MALNDAGGDAFDNQIEDEDGSIYPPPGVEMLGTLALQPDRGSGSYAEDGRLEVAEDIVMPNGEDQVGSAAMYGPTEIGSAAMYGPTEIGLYSENGASEIGLYPVDGATEIGRLASMYGQAEIGLYSENGATEIGLFPRDGASEIGQAEDIQDPFESFMMGPTRTGDWSPEQGHMVGDWSPEQQGHMVGDWSPEQGHMIGDWSPEQGHMIGGEIAVVKVVAKARDNRQPPPPMKAVDVDEEMEWPDNWSTTLTNTLVGAAAVATTATASPTVIDPFPLTSQFMLRCGAGIEPRYVRVDTEESYKKFRQENSPEIQALHQALKAHMEDPSAHQTDDDFLSDGSSQDVNDIVILGQEVQAAEKDKEIELWMPRHFDGQVSAWREGDFVCTSMRIPGFDGEVRICTTLEPLQKCIAEMSRHAVEANVPASSVVGVLPAMGCVLGAGTALKEMAAAAPSIASRPEMKRQGSFIVRIEPKVSPALCALAMLVLAVEANVPGAADEWAKLASLSPAPIQQAMAEAIELAKKADASNIGGFAIANAPMNAPRSGVTQATQVLQNAAAQPGTQAQDQTPAEAAQQALAQQNAQAVAQAQVRNLSAPDPQGTQAPAALQYAAAQPGTQGQDQGSQAQSLAIQSQLQAANNQWAAARAAEQALTEAWEKRTKT